MSMWKAAPLVFNHLDNITAFTTKRSFQISQEFLKTAMKYPDCNIGPISCCLAWKELVDNLLPIWIASSCDKECRRSFAACEL